MSRLTQSAQCRLSTAWLLLLLGLLHSTKAWYTPLLRVWNSSDMSSLASDVILCLKAPRQLRPNLLMASRWNQLHQLHCTLSSASAHSDEAPAHTIAQYRSKVHGIWLLFLVSKLLQLEQAGAVRR